MTSRILVMPGDGVGPEICREAVRVLDVLASDHGLDIELDEALVGGAAVDGAGDPLPDDSLAAAREADAILFGAIGGPKWDSQPRDKRPESGLLRLRSELGLFANLRPAILYSQLAHASSLKQEIVAGLDIMIVRELTGGIYFGKRQEGETHATDECAYSAEEVERVARIAFKAAQGRSGRLTSVDKANVLASSRLWRRVVVRMQAEEFPDVTLDHMLVDAMAMKLIEAPAWFDVILTENMFGDILSDEASVLAGSIGLAPSASLGDGVGIYEPIHGSAPDIAGQGKANPLGMILSAAMMLRHSLDAADAADAIEAAVQAHLASSARTADLGGTAGTGETAEAVAARLSE